MSDKEDFAFKAFKVKRSNVLLAWEKVKHQLGVDKQEKIEGKEVKLPNVEVYCITDEDYVDMHLYRDKESAKRSKLLQVAEYGLEVPEEATSAFTRLFWNKETGKFERAEIYIRNSIYEKSEERFYKSLEHEMRHVLMTAILKN